jgi:two-component system OmpR family response regulator/two-component system response regulator TctD
MRVLLAEDDPTLRMGLVQALSDAGHEAIGAADGAHADTLLATSDFDLLVLDLGLPRMDGLDVLVRLRARRAAVNRSLPVLILSARDSMEARVRGLDGGADDYLTKPFDLPEFEARVRALLRRGQSTTLAIGRLEWDWAARQGTIDGRPLSCSPHETALVEALLRKAGRIVTKANLASLIGDDGIAVENKVEVYIHRLRRKMTDAGIEIRNVRGLGYLLRIDEGTPP